MSIGLKTIVTGLSVGVVGLLLSVAPASASTTCIFNIERQCYTEYVGELCYPTPPSGERCEPIFVTYVGIRQADQ